MKISQYSRIGTIIAIGGLLAFLVMPANLSAGTLSSGVIYVEGGSATFSLSGTGTSIASIASITGTASGSYSMSGPSSYTLSPGLAWNLNGYSFTTLSVTQNIYAKVAPSPWYNASLAGTGTLSDGTNSSQATFSFLGINLGGILYVNHLQINTLGVTPVPEPSMILMLGIGLFAVAGGYMRLARNKK